MRAMRMAIVGLGGMGTQHMQMIRGDLLWNGIPVGGPIENLTVAGSYDIREERQQFARENGLRAYASLDELLEDPSIDFVTVATPNDLHKEIVVQALRSGKGAISEKPVTLCSADLHEMIDASKETGKLFTVHQNRRWDDDYVTVKKMVEEDYLGETLRIESRVPGASGAPGGWRSHAEHGGGLLFDWGVHILDQALDMIPQKVKYVYGSLTHVIHQEVDDGFHVELTFEGGLSYCLEAGNSNFIPLPRWYVIGTNGSAVVEDFLVNGRSTRMTTQAQRESIEIALSDGRIRRMASRAKLRERGSTVTEPLPIKKVNMQDFYRNVMAAILGEAEPIVKQEQVMRVMRLMEAIRESDRTHCVVEFEK